MINYLITLIIRDILIYLFFPVVIPDEAYYIFWGQNLKLKYYDHPFITGLISSISKKKNKLINRMPFLILSILTHIIVYYIYDIILIDQECKIISYSFYSLFNFSFPIVLVDTIFNFLWYLCIYISINILNTNSTIISLFPIVFLGLSTKYNFILIFLVWFGLAMQKNELFYNIESYITIIATILFYAPLFLNNYKSYLYQCNHLIKKNYKKKIFGFVFILITFIFFNFLNFNNFTINGTILAKSYIYNIYLFSILITIFFKTPELNWFTPLYSIFIFPSITFKLSKLIIILFNLFLLIIFNIKKLYKYNSKTIYMLKMEELKNKKFKILISNSYSFLSICSFYLPSNIKLYFLGNRHNEFNTEENIEYIKKIPKNKIIIIKKKINNNMYFIE